MIRIRPVRPIRTVPSNHRPSRRILAALAASLTLILGLITVPTSSVANVAPNTDQIFSDTIKPAATTADTRPVNLGLKFKSDRTGSIVALQFYRSSKQKQAYEASLWDGGRRIGQATFPASATEGWQTAELTKPVELNKGRWYVASYLAADGQFAYTEGAIRTDISVPPLTARVSGGQYTYSSSSVMPTTSGKGTSYMLDVVFLDRDAPAVAPTPTQTTAAPTPTPTPTTAAPTPTPTATRTSAAPTPTPTTAAPTPTATQTLSLIHI